MSHHDKHLVSRDLVEGLIQSDNPKNIHLDLWELVSHLGFINLDLSGEIITYLRGFIGENDWRSIILDLGMTRYDSLSGMTYKSAAGLQRIQVDLAEQTKVLPAEVRNELYALYYYLWTALKGKIGVFHENHLQLTLGKSLTSIKSFKLAFEYALARYEAGQNIVEPETLLPIAQRLEKQNLHSLAAMAYREVGILNRRLHKYEHVVNYYEKSFELASKHSIPLAIDQYYVSLGYYHYWKKDYNLAAEILNKVKLDPPNGVTTILALENQAVVHEALNQYEKALELIETALKVSRNQDCLRGVPTHTLYLGTIYENRMSNLSAAENVLRLGFESAIKSTEVGLTLNGDRKKVVEAYLDFLKRHRKPAATVKKIKDSFAFAQGKRWKDIKETFHHQLMIYHRQSCATGKALAHKLSMPPTTLYSLQNRLKARGFQLENDHHPSHDLQTFIQDHKDLSWDEINEIFEREMMLYLYEKYGYNKLRMSKILDLSYTMIIDKTREITSLDDRLLQN